MQMALSLSIGMEAGEVGRDEIRRAKGMVGGEVRIPVCPR